MKNILPDIIFALKLALTIIVFSLFTIGCGHVFVLWLGGKQVVDVVFCIKALFVVLFWLFVNIYLIIRYDNR